MESLLARALESKLKYWLRSFTRDQFKLQGRSVQLRHLDVNGDVLHSTLGLPPSLSVTQARIGKLELKLPYISNVKTEPIIVEIDKLDLVLAEKSEAEPEACGGSSGSHTSATGRSSSYGFADQIADGMTVQVGTVNLMLETRGGSRGHGGAAWTPPLASITMRGLMLYTTNEHWEVVNLKEARNFSLDKCIYVFKKLEWESISVDLLPHPDMFADGRLSSSSFEGSRRDSDGAKRLFFGGERFLENISGTAYITMHRTEQNNPVGLEVQLLLPEAVCPALSEPGLRAFLRFMTGFYVCLNRGDMVPTTVQTDESPSRTLVGVTVEHIFLGIKDADFRLELLAQSLRYIRASNPEGHFVKTLSKLSLGGLFLRDTFSQPSCTLIQPSMVKTPHDLFSVPTIASERLWPRIYPLVFQHASIAETQPLLCIYSSQTIPSPAPPTVASQTVIQCQPLKINLQEKSCLQIASFLADGIVVEPGVVLPDTSLNSTYFSLRGFDLTIPLNPAKIDHQDVGGVPGFTGARLHVEGFMFADSPTLSYRLLKLDSDPACFAFWKGQLPDSSQKRWVVRANQLSVALETGNSNGSAQLSAYDQEDGLWHCIEMVEPCLEVAMVTADGLPLLRIPPPGGVVRLGIACKHFISNTSIEQLLFVLEMYSYLGEVGQALARVDTKRQEKEYNRSKSFGGLIEAAPADSAVSFGLDCLEIKFLESLSGQWNVEGPALAKFIGSGINFIVTHRTLSGAIAVSSTLYWKAVRVECVDTEPFEASADFSPEKTPATREPSTQGSKATVTEEVEQIIGTLQQTSGPNQERNMRAILWVHDELESVPPADIALKKMCTKVSRPFLDISVVHMMPFRAEDAECHSLKVTAKVSGVRLGGGMIYTESLLYRFGVFGPDGGPGTGFEKVLKSVSNGPLAHLFQPSHVMSNAGKTPMDPTESTWELKRPEDVELDVQLIDWLFALEGAKPVGETRTEEACWHSTFKCLHVRADREKPHGSNTIHCPVQGITVSIEGLQALKPRPQTIEPCQLLENGYYSADTKQDSSRTTTKASSNDGLAVEVRLIAKAEVENAEIGIGEWIVDSVRASVKEPVEMEATKSELEFLVDVAKAEVEAASRIAVGVLKLLQLQGSLGQAAIEQLSSLGSGSLDKYMTSPKSSRRASISSVSGTPYSSLRPRTDDFSVYVADQLQESVSKSQQLCRKIEQESSRSDSSSVASANLLLLAKQLNEMQDFISSLKL